MTSPAVLEQLREVPQADFARAFLKIVDKNRQLVPLDITGRPGQRKIADARERQQQAGQPVRIIIVKSRQTGSSTWAMGDMLRRSVTMPNRNVLVVAQKMPTAAALWMMAYRMYLNLPLAVRDALKGYADIAGKANPTRGTKVLHFGVEGQGAGTGIDSVIQVDTASEVDAGRGFTFTDLVFTEAAHWDDEEKAGGILPAVPDRPHTAIYIESTANGMNWFHARFKAAIEGKSEYEPIFIGWHEDPDCTKPFVSDDARARFVESIGDKNVSPYAEQEPELVEQFGCTPEQLHWRRLAIVDKCDGKIEMFQQEYPSTWTEAFIGSGRQVFSIVFTQRALRETEHYAALPVELGGPRRGLFVGTRVQERQLMDGTVRVPTAVEWVPEDQVPARCEWWPGQFWQPRDPLWTLWLPDAVWPGREWTPSRWREAQEQGLVDLEQMERGMARALLGPGQFVIAGDPADDIENNSPAERDEHAFNALVGIDHSTGVQVAEFQARTDHDLVARHAFLCGLFLNEAWLSIERTGGYGNAILRLLRHSFYYRRLYAEKVLDTRKQKETSRDGWDTNRNSKPQMEATAQALLREESHGIRSTGLALEFTTYVKDEKNHKRHEPSPGSFSDRLMAWMQAQEIRRLKPLRPAPVDGDAVSSITRRFGE